MVRCGLLLVIAVSQVSAFVAPLQRNMFSRHYDVTRNASPPASSDKVIVLTDAAAVSKEVQDRVAAAAAAAIKAKGHFALAIPGGSILKMLQGTSPSWAKDTTIAYVNHKCVQMTDIKLSTHAKATELFLKDWAGVDVITLTGSGDSTAEATTYESEMRARATTSKIPISGYLPVFDMMLIGVGDDGHVGSLYPGRSEVADASGAWVLPVDMKEPGSISLSLSVMAGASEVIIAACGVSDKYPQGKSAGMARAIEGEETSESFPASALRSVATWIIDEAAASKLSSEYQN